MAKDTGCTFILTQQLFTLANGDPKDGYIMDDGVHLNERGSSKLVERLQLPMVDPSSRKVTRMAGYRHKNELSKDSFAKVASQQKQLNKSQGKAATKARNGKNESAKQSTTVNNSRPQPMCKETGFCGYCREPGHWYKECRHGGPVTCRSYREPTHKEKSCKFHAK